MTKNVAKTAKKEHVINVQPIRDRQTVNDFIWALERYYSKRDALLFKLGISTGLRVSDLVDIKVHEVSDLSDTIMYEIKTGKRRNLTVPSRLVEELKDFTKDMDGDDYLFSNKKRPGAHIGTSRVYKIFKDVGDRLGLDYIGTHTMRKTFGYVHYKQFNDVVALMKYFNHSSVAVTLAYIGITDEELRAQVEELSIYD